MAKVNVKVLKAVVDGKGEGSTLSIDERSAKHLESIGYVQIEAEQPKRETSADEKGESAPKKSAPRKRKSKAKATDEGETTEADETSENK